MMIKHDTVALKQCAKCKSVLPRECFYKNRANSDGLNSYCKVCFKSNFRPSKEGKRQNLKSRVLIKEGQRFNHLVAIREDGAGEYRGRMWLCECDCGEHRRVEARELAGGRAISCGCLNRGRKDANFRRVFGQYKKAAQQRGHEWQLVEQEALELFQGNCFYCDTPPLRTQDVVKGREPFVFNGIDRLNSEIGYIFNNCVPCCTKCNYAKNTMSPQEFEDHIILIYNNLIKRKER
jgi:hypothetical protein